MTPTAEQKRALDEIVEWARNPSDVREMSLSGPAGTGKTTLMKLLAQELWSVVAITWTALTGKAARRMSEAADVPATTLHKPLYWPPRERTQELRFVAVRPWALIGSVNDIVVIDEASMTTPKLKADLETWIQEGARVLYVGDGYQLPPIMGSADRRRYGENYTIFQEVEGPTLTKVIRNDDAILQIATAIRDTGKLPQTSNDRYEFRAAPIKTGIIDYLKDDAGHALITWRNDLRMAINNTIRRAHGRANTLPEPGEPILFTQNGGGVLNGQATTIDRIERGAAFGPIESYRMHADPADPEIEDPINVVIDGQKVAMDGKFPHLDDAQFRAYTQAIKDEKRAIWEETGFWEDVRPIPITWGYCLTAHKAQGSEYDRVTIILTDRDASARPMSKLTLLPDGRRIAFALRWLYTAITRGKSRVTVVVGAE